MELFFGFIKHLLDSLQLAAWHRDTVLLLYNAQANMNWAVENQLIIHMQSSV